MIRTSATWRPRPTQFRATVGVTEDDVILTVVALFHAHGLGNGLLAAVRSGATSCSARSSVTDPRGDRARTGHDVPGGAVHLPRPGRDPTRGHGGDRTVATVRVGRAPRSAESTHDLFRDRFGHPIRQLYGCSEAGSVTINLGADPAAGWDSVGQPMCGIELGVIDDDGVRRARGASGEITFRSPALTNGYVGVGARRRGVRRRLVPHR